MSLFLHNTVRYIATCNMFTATSNTMLTKALQTVVTNSAFCCFEKAVETGVKCSSEVSAIGQVQIKLIWCCWKLFFGNLQYDATKSSLDRLQNACFLLQCILQNLQCSFSQINCKEVVLTYYLSAICLS